MERGGLQMMLLIFVSAVAAESPCSIAEASVPDVAALRKLLDGGAKPDECRSWVFRFTALMRAAANGHVDVVDALLTAGADPNGRNLYASTPLLKAARNGHTSAVLRLLAEDAIDVDAQDWFGKSALMQSAVGGHDAVTALLLEAKADPDLRDIWGNSAVADANSKRDDRHNLQESEL